jgi:hypothetical protein
MKNSGVVGFCGATTLIARGGSVNQFMQLNANAMQSHGLRHVTGEKSASNEWRFTWIRDRWKKLSAPLATGVCVE